MSPEATPASRGLCGDSSSHVARGDTREHENIPNQQLTGILQPPGIFKRVRAMSPEATPASMKIFRISSLRAFCSPRAFSREATQFPKSAETGFLRVTPEADL